MTVSPGGPLFGHPPTFSMPTVSDTTRRLSAGAYLEDDFAYQVIKETTDDEFRAVPPSIGFDLEPVIRHSFRARKLLLIRDLLLTAILVIGFALVPGLVTAWVLLAGALNRWRRDRKRPVVERRFGVVLGLLALALVSFSCLSYASPLLFLLQGTGTGQTAANDPYGYAGTDSSLSSVTSQLDAFYNGALLTLLFLLPVAMAVLTLGVLVGSRVAVFRALTRSLARGSQESAPTLPNERISRRVGWIAGAQRGNVSLHSRNPFMGCGRSVALWSMALLLQGRPKHVTTTGAEVEPGARFQRDETFDPLTISARELQRLVRQGVLALSDQSLPANQRVPGVYVLDRVVADGERYQGDPLIDGQSRYPYEMASPEAVAAIIDQPQGGVRHYQQMLIGVQGRAVTLPDGRPVLPAQPQDIVVSAHLHVAVEGGKLYIEFLGTVLPPVRRTFNQVDRLRPDLWWMLVRGAPEILSAWLNSVRAPLRALRYLRQILAGNSRARSARLDVREFKSYDHGARLSVRELGAEDWAVTFLQDLDAFKYIKLVEKTVLQTVLDYLDGQGVDTSEYRAQMIHLEQNQNIMNSPNFQGPVAFGTGASATKL